MQCEEFELILQRQLDGESSAIEYESIREHALRCGSCGELQDGMRLLIQSFASDQVPPLPLGLADRICSAAMQKSHQSRVQSVGWLVAAMVLGAVGLSIHWLTLPKHPIATLAERPIIQTQPKAQEVLFPELSGPNAMDSRQAIPIMDAVEPVSRLVRALGRSLGNPVRPIAVSTSEAMTNLIKDLPDTESAAIPIPVMRDMMGPTPSKKMQGMAPSS